MEKMIPNPQHHSITPILQQSHYLGLSSIKSRTQLNSSEIA